MAALVCLVDIGDPAVLGAAQAGLQRFGASLCLQAPPPPAAGAGEPALGARHGQPIVGLTNLAKPQQAAKPVLQVRCRPGPFVLRDFHAAVSRLQASGGATGGVTGAIAAAVLQQLVGLVAADAACAAAGGQPTVLHLTDRTDYDPDDFRTCLEVCRGKGVRVEVVVLAAERLGEPAADALAAAWQDAEAAFPHLAVVLVPGAGALACDRLASTLAQRFGGQPGVAVNLQFKQPLVGSIRALQLSCQAEVRPLGQAVQHAALCPCHGAPAAWAACAACTCAVSGAALDRRQCRRDERTVQVGQHPGGALHFAAPFDIGSVSRGGSAALLSIMARVKADQANPAVLFGLPLVLSAAPAGQCFKVMHEGEMADVSTQQLLGVVCTSLSAAGEALLASSTTDLETGAAGLFRLHYLLLPCTDGESSSDGGAAPALCAKRVASADELVPPLLAAEAAAPAALLPPALAEAVAGQLGAVPLEARLDPLALSSRCRDTIEMLVRESQPLPKPQMPPPPAPEAAAPAPAAAPTPAPARTPAAPPAAAAQAKGRRAAAPAPVPAAAAAPRESGGRGAGGGKAGKGALEFRRSARR